jgi:hypothetical protein
MSHFATDPLSHMIWVTNCMQYEILYCTLQDGILACAADHTPAQKKSVSQLPESYGWLWPGPGLSHSPSTENAKYTIHMLSQVRSELFQTCSLSYLTSSPRLKALGGQEYISVGKNNSQEHLGDFASHSKALLMTQIDLSPSLLFCRLVYKYKALPLSKIIFSLL